jgi:uncharacterized protein YraI
MKPTTTFRTILFVVVALALLSGLVARPATAQTRIDLDVKRAVVRIVPERCYGGTNCIPQSDQPGSGVIIHPSGLILTAWHVLSADKDFQKENYWGDFVVEMIDEDDGVPPAPRYRARIVATRPEMDLAILRIDRTLDRRPVTEEALAALPWLPVYDGLSSQLESGNTQLHILGYPKPPLPTDSTTLSTNQNLSLNRRDSLAAELEVQLLFDKGYSGGPALTQREGVLQVAGIVLASVGNRTKLRDLSVALRGFEWVTEEEKVYAENVNLTQTAVDGMPFLQLEADVHALGLEDIPLQFQISFYEASSRQPWRPITVDLPQLNNRQVYWLENLRPDRPVYHHTLRVLIPMAGAEIQPELLVFRMKLAREDNSVQLWSDNRWYQAQAAQTVDVPIPPTSTPTPTPTPDTLAEVEAGVRAATFQAAVRATLTALVPTPTNTSVPSTPTRISPTSFFTPTSTYTVITTSAPDAVVNSSRLNLRAGPNINYAILGSYPRGTLVELLGKNRDETWVKVRTPDRENGWMSVSLLTVNRSLVTVPVAEIPSTPTPSALQAIATPTFVPGSNQSLGGETVQLLSPPDNTTGSGKVIFTWRSDYNLGSNEWFELIFWESGQDPLTQGFGVASGPVRSTSVEVDIGANSAIQQKAYLWGVRLVKTSPYVKLRFFGGGRTFIKTETGSGQPVQTSVLPTPVPP